MKKLSRPTRKSKTGAPRRDVRIVRPLPIDPNLPEWLQVQLQAWSARRAIRVLRRLRRADPNIPAARIVELQLTAIRLETRIQALAVRFPPPTQPTPPASDAPPPARELSRRDEIRRSQPETRTGPPPRNDNGPLLRRGPTPAAEAACRFSSATIPTIDRFGPHGKRVVKRAGLPPRGVPTFPRVCAALAGARPRFDHRDCTRQGRASGALSLGFSRGK
jgi:hypothetical protein